MGDNAGKKGFFSKVADSFKGYKGEFKKIVWPSWASVLKNTGIVIAFILLIAIFVYVVDLLFGGLFNFVVGLL